VPSATPSDVTAAQVRQKTALRDVNLLRMTDARVAVSSTVDNPRDFPGFLVDGSLDTAWQSRTGNLVGAWIAFLVPRDASVTRVEMTAGYSRVLDTVDLFAANYRITEVEVFRDEKTLGRFPLDADKRTLQLLPISGPGGEYRIVITKVTPGTERNWRELAVSELRVIGSPGAKLRELDEPLEVAVGALDALVPSDITYWVHDVDTEETFYRSPVDYCRAFVKLARETAVSRLAEAREQGVERMGTLYCNVSDEHLLLPPSNVYQSLVVVNTSDGLGKERALLVQLSEGFIALPIAWQQADPFDPGCPSFFRPEKVEKVRIENGYLVVSLTERKPNWAQEDEHGHTPLIDERGAVWCRALAGRLSCKSYRPEMSPSLPEFTVARDGSLKLK
jgi:hypothetical protein